MAVMVDLFFWKPCWHSARISWEFRKERSRVSMIFSISLDIEERREMGL